MSIMDKSLAHTEDTQSKGESFLEHYGVPGMKWGVRKARPRGKIRRGLTKANVATKAGAKVIGEGEKKLIFLPEKARNDAASGTHSRVLGEARKINKDPQFRHKDLKRDPALKKAYFDQVESKAVKIYQEELAKARIRVSADLIDSFMNPNRDSLSITAPRDRLQHDDNNEEVLLQLDFDLDELGQIADVTVPDKFLAHYGVPGMKWGVRKSEGSGPTPATAIQKKPGGKVKATGGEGHPAHEDAKKAAENIRKAKKSRSDALSNQELQDAIKRMQLEQQFASLQKGRQNAGRKFIQRLLGDTASQQVSSVVNTQAAAEIDKQLRKHGRPVAAKSKYKD